MTPDPTDASALSRVRRALAGVSGVAVTPYRADGEPDWALAGAVARGIAEAGVPNVVAAGNTGEFYPLTPAEIGRCHAALAEAVGDRALVTAGVGRSLREAVQQSRDAAAAGCGAVMVHHPLDPFAAPSAQVGYVMAVADAAPVPVIAYLRADGMSPADLARLAAHNNVAGVKYASTNLLHLSAAIRASEDAGAAAAEGGALWVCGLAEAWAAPFRALGARGFTSGLVNVWPERSLAIAAALEAGAYDEARRLVAAIAPFEAMRARHGHGANVTVVKEALGMLGRPVGPVRLPGLPELSDAERAELRGIVAGWGLTPAGEAAARGIAA